MRKATLRSANPSISRGESREVTYRFEDGSSTTRPFGLNYSYRNEAKRSKRSKAKK